CVRRNEDADVW
nr:immunoglobulin heavy chain junction region [Macaca mulatta]